MRVAVTGATGNVGCEVVRACIDVGLDVQACARRPKAGQVQLDFLDRGTWADAVTKCKGLFLLRPPAISDVENTLNPFIDFAYAHGVDHIVFVSVAGADRMPWVPHRKVELHLEAQGKSFTILRPGFFAQNLQDAYRRDIVEDDRVYVPAGDGRVAFLDVADMGAIVANVFIAPEQHAGQRYTLTGPQAVTFREVAKRLSAVLGRTIRYEAASIPAYAYHLWRRRRLEPMQVAIQTYLHVRLRAGDAERVDPAAERLLGRRPASIEAYITRAAATWQPKASSRRSR